MSKLNISKAKSIILLSNILLIFLISLPFGQFQVMAEPPTSDQYKLDSYSFGTGGISGADSGQFSLFAVTGETSSYQLTSAQFKTNPGLTFQIEADTPQPPTFINPADNYDRLQLVINPGSNPSDTLFAVAISDDDWSTTRYVQSDYTIGDNLGSEDWLPYNGANSWGGSSGKFIKGLKQDTTYKVKVTAMSGKYTQSPYSTEVSAKTSVPSLSFGISNSSLNFDNLNASNSFTDSAKTTVLTTSTNAYNGYTIFAHSLGALDFNSKQIADFSSPNSEPTSWSGTGFGYTTSDNNLTGGAADRFTLNGPKYAGFTTSTPGDPIADHTDVVENSSINNEQFTVSYRVSASGDTPAGSYKTQILYIVVPVY